MKSRLSALRSIRKELPYFALIVASCSLWMSGCQCKQYIDDQLAYCEPIDEACTSWHARSQAHKAWKQFGHLCAEDDPHRCYFKDGFYDGFINVATGGDGCLPVLPPRKYWKSCYESPAGQLKICAYFQGYPQGVQAAYEFGAARTGKVPTSMPGYLKSAGAYCPNCPNEAGHPTIYESEEFTPVPASDIPTVPPPPGRIDTSSGLGPFLPDSADQPLDLLAPPVLGTASNPKAEF